MIGGSTGPAKYAHHEARIVQQESSKFEAAYVADAGRRKHGVGDLTKPLC